MSPSGCDTDPNGPSAQWGSSEHKGAEDAECILNTHVPIFCIGAEHCRNHSV